jgi:hypothetical protein
MIHVLESDAVSMRVQMPTSHRSFHAPATVIGLM